MSIGVFSDGKLNEIEVKKFWFEIQAKDHKCLDREIDMVKIMKELKKNNLVVVYGESGIGKASVVK